MVVHLRTKLLIVGDSVMGCFLRRREMVTHLPARFICWSLGSVFGKKVRAAMQPRKYSSGLVASSVLSYPLRVWCYPQRYAKTETLVVEAPVFRGPIKRRNVLECQAKIVDSTAGRFGFHNYNDIHILHGDRMRAWVTHGADL
jgi:hypothetical protein